MIWLTVSFTYCWVGPTHGNVYTLSGKDIDIRLAGITKLYGVSDYMKTQRVFGVEALCQGWDWAGFYRRGMDGIGPNWVEFDGTLVHGTG